MAAYYNDHDPEACEWLRELIRAGLIADGEVDERSILDVRPDDLRGFVQCHFFAGIGGWSYALRLAGIPDDRPVWTGSPPCQPFSAAGQRKGRDDARHLGPHFVSLVGACRPPLLFGEQVASSDVFGKATGRAAKAAPGQPAWAWVDDLCDRLEASRYAVGSGDIPAAGVGAPHIRQRCFFGAVRMAYAHGEGWRQAGCERTRDLEADQGRSRNRDGDAGPIGGLGDCQRIGEVNAGRPHEADSPWRDADWLHCRDGRWRPVEAGTFPLAPRLPGRVALLRGAGNSIVPQAAAAFVRAFVDVMEAADAA